MPKIRNTSGIKPGSIYRIELENFLTYGHVTIFPGPSLNMIVGPNGTGKSTFVCAIVLGLCGKLASLKRFSKISECIRRGCSSATITIELYNERDQDNVSITRKFDSRDVTHWYIDNRPTSQKTVIDVISRLKIQVDNLCQLLPQDRVKDFAKMDSHTLLKSTLTAVGKEDKVQQLEELKKFRSESSSANENLKKNEEKKQALIKENERLKMLIDAINQRKEIERQIKVCECKKLWIEERHARDKCREYQDKKKAADKILKKTKEKLRPLQDTLGTIDDTIKQLEHERLALNVQITTLNENITDMLQSVKIREDEIKSEELRYLQIKEQLAGERDELKKAKLHLEMLKNNKKIALQKYGEESELKGKLHRLNKPMEEMRQQKSRIERQMDEIQNEYDSRIFPEMRRCQNRIRILQNVDDTRQKTLAQASSNAMEAWQWLKNNKHQFQQPFYGPMMLEINFSEERYARYLEATVPRRDLLAFTFSCTADMDRFLELARRRMQLPQVNAVCSPQGQQRPPTPDVREIRQFGFQKYLVDTFTAPDIIVQYLCRTYNIHNIPIGNDHTYNVSETIPTHIKLFFSENHRFAVRISKYSNARTSTMSMIQSPRLLADSLDLEQLNTWKQALAPLERQEAEFKKEKENLEVRLREIKQQYEEKEREKVEITNNITSVQTQSLKILQQERTVHELESRPVTDIEAERRQCKRRQTDSAAKIVKLQLELADEALRPLHQHCARKLLVTLKLKKTRNTKVEFEEKMRQFKNDEEKARGDFEKLKQLEQNALSVASEKLAEAKRASNNKQPRDPGFPHRDVYASLPDDLGALQQHRLELETRTQCMSHNDEADLRTYNSNKEQIEKLMAFEKKSKEENQKIEQRMKKLKLEWLPSVKLLLSDINQQFSGMIAKFGCAGEVRLKQGTCEEEFSAYGVSVLVQFRAGEPLSELTAYTQSGGERSLSTALYLLAMQRLAAAPFRCVDEINQGMDSKNERILYELLVKVTTDGEQGQYFVLTPTLLKSLEYNRKVKVHTIMNGPRIMPDDQWRMESFLAKGRALRG